VRLTLAAVFLLSRQCNLRCDYCNVEAEPTARDQLDPRLFEAWVSSFAALPDVDIGIQLHGGEPLMVDPPVEAYAAIARNAVAPALGARMGTISLVTNGTLLDERRAQSLERAGLSVAVSIDGSQATHDRFRRTASGQGSHARAVKALDVLRATGLTPRVIAVVTQPDDVLEAFDFFMSQQVSRFRINPMRLEGRGASVRSEDVANTMVALAEQQFLLARRLAAHNRVGADQIYEENVHLLMSRIMGIGPPPSSRASWTLLVDEHGDLWSHPGGRGIDRMRLSHGERPTVETVARALGLESPTVTGETRARQLRARRIATFAPCVGCADPNWCDEFRPLAGPTPEAPIAPDCRWRIELTRLLQAWRDNSPDDAASVVRPAHGTRCSTGPAIRSRSVEDGARCHTGSVTPTVQAILDDVVWSGGRAHIRAYADWVARLHELSPPDHEETFVQLAAIARDLSLEKDSLPVARSLAQLARLGLLGLVQRERIMATSITRRARERAPTAPPERAAAPAE